MNRYLQRSKELGLNGVLRRIYARSIGRLILLFQSLWWRLKTRKKMSNSSLLARTTGDWKTIDDLLMHLASRTASSFVLPHESPEETRRILEKHYPQHLSEILDAADAISKNQVNLAGHIFNYQADINWQQDPVTGLNWPILYRKRMGKYFNATRPVDLILFWKLNRHQNFISLGIAYWLTGDQRYVDSFIDQVQSWIKDNPLEHGMNWSNPIEISMRLIAWTTAFQFFRTSPKFQKEVGEEFIKSLWQQTDFTSRHLQPVLVANDTPNNHMIAELTGLILVSTAFPEFSATAKWRETAFRLLLEQVDIQTHSDGVNKEQTTGYHRFAAELLLLVLAGNYREGIKRESILEEKLEKMLDYILYTLLPDGTTPMWGDTDFGRALGLDQNKNFWDFRPLLSTGAVLFERPDWKFAADRFDEESFWLLGTEGMQKWEQLATKSPKEISCAFPQGGHYIIRDSWETNTDVAFFRCGEFGLGGEGHCAHAHSDLLSFILWVNGQPLLVDSGTYTYHGPMRDYFRLASAHNTVKIDGRDQAIPLPNFKWQQIPKAKNKDWSENSVTGVLNYAEVTFTRNLSHPRQGVWILGDEFSGNDKHKIEWFFNFAPGFDFELKETEKILEVNKNGAHFLNVVMPNSNISAELDDAWYSYQYATKQSTNKLHVQWQGTLKEKGEKFNWKFELVDNETVEGIRKAKHVTSL
jgi:hypothetical protein